MTRIKTASFIRAQEYERDAKPSDLKGPRLPLWLESFAKEYSKQEKTAVEVARKRQDDSIYGQMNAIVGGNVASPKFSSVEAVVEDIKERIGLTEYLKKIHSLDAQEAAKQVLAAVSEDDTEKKNPEFGKKIKIPDIVQKHPGISTFIQNLVETSYGIQIPAIQEAVAVTFARDGVRQQDVYDSEFAKYINMILADRQMCLEQGDYSNLGRGVGVQKEFDYTGNNPFSSLMPARNTY